jgi:hypothetical protein
MTGKTDGPADVDKSTEHRGSSVGTPGLTALDEEREASLADEGGASASRRDTRGPASPVAAGRTSGCSPGPWPPAPSARWPCARSGSG